MSKVILSFELCIAIRKTTSSLNDDTRLPSDRLSGWYLVQVLVHKKPDLLVCFGHNPSVLSDDFGSKAFEICRENFQDLFTDPRLPHVGWYTTVSFQTRDPSTHYLPGAAFMASFTASRRLASSEPW